MSEQTRIEITGNIQVHHPIREQAEATVIEYQPWFNKEWEAIREQVAA